MMNITCPRQNQIYLLPALAAQSNLMDTQNISLNRMKDYHDFFLRDDINEQQKQTIAEQFLQQQIASLNIETIDFPAQIQTLDQWCQQKHYHVAQQYQHYLSNRRAGQGRSYFPHVSAAFEFLIKVAPTKRVDGAWLYSTVKYWNDARFRELIITYLEELGLGAAKANHVCVFDELLDHLGLEDFDDLLSDADYHQPAIQLALAYAPEHLMPEIIGFNFGYEQLPLHLLITNYELSELGIDGQYFNLHITIDNAHNGHAHRAVKLLKSFYANAENKDEFLRKVKCGYALNDLGVSSNEVIKNLNVEKMVTDIFKIKADFGKYMHNDKCKIGTQTVNQWLAQPEQMPKFVQSMQDRKLVRMNQHPDDSLFWRMIHQEDGKMFGVFNQMEKCFIYDWIGGEDYAKTSIKSGKVKPKYSLSTTYSDTQKEDLNQSFYRAKYLEEKINCIIPYLAPHQHAQPRGLWATHQYIQFLFPHYHLI